MNNSFQRSNDMNSFRSSIAGSIARYDNNIAAGNARVLQARTNALQQAKELKGTGDSLEKIGLEVTTATHAVTGTVKSIKNAYTKVVDAKNKVKDSVENIKNRFNQRTASGETESTAEEAANEDVSESLTSGPPQELRQNYAGAADRSSGVETAETVGGDESQGGGIEYAEREYDLFGDTDHPAHWSNSVGNDFYDGLERYTTSQQQESTSAETGAAEDAGNEVSAATGVEDAETTASGLEDATSLVTSGASDVATALASTASDATSAVTSAASAAAETALAETASLTSWIPFVGEVVGGMAAVGGLVEAGIGVYDEMRGSAQEKAANRMPTQLAPTQIPKLNVAGTYMAPVASSVNV